MARWIGILACIGFLFASDVFGKEQTLLFSGKGEIYSVDRSEKTALIGGYRYRFSGKINGSSDPEVKMLGYNSGSYEMLEVGMKVSFKYVEVEQERWIISLTQMPYSYDPYDVNNR